MTHTELKIVIFGAPDHEEQKAREICRWRMIPTATATFQGQPVHAGNAYKADGFVQDFGPNDWQQAIIFECNPNCAGSHLVAGICDHHNPGDFGYSLPPEKFWEASSLGQMIKTLGIQEDVEGREDLLMIAAGDHCPVDAYAGRCLGIDPKRFAIFRIEQITRFSGKSTKEIAEEICRAVIKIIAEEMNVSPVEGVVDVRHYGEIPQLPEAALRLGHAYLAEIPERDRNRQKTGNRKVILGGHTTPKQVEEFLSWARSLGNRIGEPYGNPTRGYAGVVVK